MTQSEDSYDEKSSSDFMTRMIEDEEIGEEFTVEYLRTRFLSSVGRSLYYARREAGLTQAQVAERMHTQQSAIARFEADRFGSISFRRYVDFAIACGMMPTSLVTDPILEPLSTLREKLLIEVELRHIQEQNEEKFHMPSSLEISGTVSLPTNLSTSQESVQAVKYIDQFLSNQHQHTAEQIHVERSANVTSSTRLSTMQSTIQHRKVAA